MRKIKVFAHISADGLISPEGDDDYAHGGWTAPYRSADGAEAVHAAQGKGYDLLLGRRTYDLWSGFWPTMKSGALAEGINAATKYVATHRPESLSWGPVQHIGGDLIESVRCITSKDGPDLIVWGSSTVTSVLFAHGLVEEVVLFVNPVLLGRGLRFFDTTPRELALLSTKSTSTGVVMNTYRHTGALRRPEA